MIATNSMSLFLLFSSISSFLYTCASLTYCRPDQRDALLEFKSEFELRNPPEFLDEFIYDYLVPVDVNSWANSSDCCYWDGITCDVTSGVVIGVDLTFSCLHGHFKPNSSLFGLRHLQDLNLAYNDFNASPIPSGFNKLMGLRRLNLSHSWFSGQIPPENLHLTKLVSLGLSSCFNLSQSRPLFIEKPFLVQLAQNLTKLRHLYMSYVNISPEIPQMISNLTSLRSIHLHKCHLFGRLPLNALLSPAIKSIDLSTNPYLESYLPELNGSNSLVLVYLDLSETSLSGNIPDSIGNLKHLNVLKIQDSNITGKIPISIVSLSHLTSLILSSSKLSGSLPSSIGNLSYLNTLSLSSNNFAGEIPSSIQNLNRLTYVDVGNNEFTGTLPPNINSLSNLEYFDASLNFFVGTNPIYPLHHSFS
ncbi:receptor-like protein 6 [Brassica napus]|nr:receptor-like protein 6 [Brassica napus]